METHADPTYASPPTSVALSEDSATNREQLRILVVDDDETDRLVVRRYVLKSGDAARLDEAASGAEMLVHVGATLYDCILLDYYLPGEDGVTLLRAIHQHAPDTPVVIITGRGDEEIAVKLMKAGAADYVPKASLTPTRIASSLHHVLAIAREAAERRRAEEELRAQEARFRRALEIETVGVLFFTPDGRITGANDAFLRMTGYTREDVLANRVRWDELTPPEWMPRSLQAVEEYQATGRTTPYEKQYVRKDGSRFWALFAATRMSEREGVEFVLDISERKRAEEERERLLASEHTARQEAERHTERTAALQSLTAALAQALSPPEIAAVLTQQGMAALRADAAAALLLNPATEELEVISDFGYSDQTHESFLRLPLSARLPLPEAIRSGEPAFFETSEAFVTAYPMLEGNPDVDVYGSNALVPLILDGKMLGGLRFSFATPRTFDAHDRALMVALAQQCAQALERARLFAAEQAARAEAEAAVRARDEFVTLVAHDLRNPLSALLGQLQVLHRGVAQGKALTAQQLAARLERMKASVARLAAQIDELQDATHLQVGHPLELHCRPTDLVALAREAARTYQQTSASHSVQFETVVPELVGSWDAERLERVVANLVSNAIKYSPSGGAILIRVTREEDWGILTVEDHGMGIPVQDLPHVFERYRRASNVTQRITGTGLGLSSVRDIVEQHGGSITVQSQEGVGAAFTVRLPCATG